jgi:ubiquinone/menaquinone biosynthesis C-methylase UbiE
MSGNITENVRKAYDEWAKIYDNNENPTRDLNYQAIREAALEVKDKKVLEIGCGTGLNTVYLAKRAEHVTGMDISKKMLEKASQRVEKKNTEFITADITQPWELSKETFDLIVGNLVLEHVENLAHIMHEAFRVLKSRGSFYIAELHPYKQLQQSQAKFVREETGEEVLVDAFPHAISEYVNSGLEAGFNLCKMKEFQEKNEDIPRLLTLHLKKAM